MICTKDMNLIGKVNVSNTFLKDTKIYDLLNKNLQKIKIKCQAKNY